MDWNPCQNISEPSACKQQQEYPASGLDAPSSRVFHKASRRCLDASILDPLLTSRQSFLPFPRRLLSRSFEGKDIHAHARDRALEPVQEGCNGFLPKLLARLASASISASAASPGANCSVASCRLYPTMFTPPSFLHSVLFLRLVLASRATVVEQRKSPQDYNLLVFALGLCSVSIAIGLSAALSDKARRNSESQQPASFSSSSATLETQSSGWGVSAVLNSAVLRSASRSSGLNTQRDNVAFLAYSSFFFLRSSSCTEVGGAHHSTIGRRAAESTFFSLMTFSRSACDEEQDGAGGPSFV